MFLYSEKYLSFVRVTQKKQINFFKFSDGEKSAFLPYLLRNRVLYSLRYGGIETNSEDGGFIKKTKKSFIEYCRISGIKRFEIRNNPFINTVKVGRIIKKEPFAYINLVDEGEALNRIICKSGLLLPGAPGSQKLIFGSTKDLKYLDRFHHFYAAALKKRGVAAQGTSYFMNMFHYFDKNINFVYIKYKNRIIAISVVFNDGENVFMAYGGMNDLGYRLNAKAYMIYNLFHRCREAGFTRLVLGTGNDGFDSVYKFKRKFCDKDRYIYTYGAEI